MGDSWKLVNNFSRLVWVSRPAYLKLDSIDRDNEVNSNTNVSKFLNANINMTWSKYYAPYMGISPIHSISLRDNIFNKLKVIRLFKLILSKFWGQELDKLSNGY